MITISGGIISRENGSSVTYQLKCNICATVDNEKFTVTLTRGVTEVSTHKCPSCGNTQNIRIRIVENDKVSCN